MNVKRLLAEEYQRQLVLPFEWGKTDCLRTCCAFAKRLIGRDPGIHLVGKYSTETGAQRIMVKEGWRDMGDVAASMFSEIPVAQARAGDWAHIIQDGRDGLGVVAGAEIIVRAPSGLGLMPLLQARRAFRVG